MPYYYETKELDYLLGVSEYTRLSEKAPGIVYMIFVTSDIYRLGIILKEDLGDCIKIKTYLGNKFRLYIYYKIVSYTINLSKLNPILDSFYSYINLISLPKRVINFTTRYIGDLLENRYSFNYVTYIRD